MFKKTIDLQQYLCKDMSETKKGGDTDGPNKKKDNQNR